MGQTQPLGGLHDLSPLSCCEFSFYSKVLLAAIIFVAHTIKIYVSEPPPSPFLQGVDLPEENNSFDMMLFIVCNFSSNAAIQGNILKYSLCLFIIWLIDDQIKKNATIKTQISTMAVTVVENKYYGKRKNLR